MMLLGNDTVVKHPIVAGLAWAALTFVFGFCLTYLLGIAQTPASLVVSAATLAVIAPAWGYWLRAIHLRRRRDAR